MKALYMRGQAVTVEIQRDNLRKALEIEPHNNEIRRELDILGQSPQLTSMKHYWDRRR